MAQTSTTTFPISDYVVAGDLLFISGTISPGDHSFEEEVTQVMKKLEAHLKANDLSFNDLVSVIIYLETMDNYTKLNDVYRTFFEKKFPSRTCVAVLDLPLNARVEMSAVAKLKSK